MNGSKRKWKKHSQKTKLLSKWSRAMGKISQRFMTSVISLAPHFVAVSELSLCINWVLEFAKKKKKSKNKSRGKRVFGNIHRQLNTELIPDRAIDIACTGEDTSFSPELASPVGTGEPYMDLPCFLVPSGNSEVFHHSVTSTMNVDTLSQSDKNVSGEFQVFRNSPLFRFSRERECRVQYRFCTNTLLSPDSRASQARWQD
jgi:hypothetical protein